MREQYGRFIILLLTFAVGLLGGRLIRSEPAPVCGPDRCQSAQQACEYVRIHAAEVLPKDREIAREFVEAACGY